MQEAIYHGGIDQPHRVEERIFLGAGALKRISWGAVFAGLFIVLAIQFLLSLLGFGVGLSMVQPAQGNGPQASHLGIGAGIWWVVSYIIALVAGGYAAARLAGVVRSFDGVLHGLVTWALALTVTLYLLTTAVGGMLGGALGVVSSTLSATGSAAGQSLKAAAPQLAEGASSDRMQQSVQDLLRPTDPAQMSPEQAQSKIVSDVARYAAGGDGAAQARDEIIGIMSTQLGISRDDAAKRFDQWIDQTKQTASNTLQTAKQGTDEAAGIGSKASILAFVALLLGAIFASLGGMWGTQKEPRKI